MPTGRARRREIERVAKAKYETDRQDKPFLLPWEALGAWRRSEMMEQAEAWLEASGHWDLLRKVGSL